MNISRLKGDDGDEPKSVERPNVILAKITLLVSLMAAAACSDEQPLTGTISDGFVADAGEPAVCSSNRGGAVPLCTEAGQNDGLDLIFEADAPLSKFFNGKRVGDPTSHSYACLPSHSSVVVNGNVKSLTICVSLAVSAVDASIKCKKGGVLKSVKLNRKYGVVDGFIEFPPSEEGEMVYCTVTN